MNLLEPTKISFKNKKNEKTIDVKPNVEIKIKNDFNSNLLSRSKFTKKYFYRYLVILSSILFCYFAWFVFNNSYNSFSKNNYSFIELLDLVNDLDYLDINNMAVESGRLKVVVDVKRYDFLNSALIELENINDNLKIKMNSGLTQIWINEKHDVGDNFNLNETILEIKSIDNLDIELDIVKNNLIVVGNLDDFKKIFEYFEKVNYKIFEFNLELINYDSKQKYYKLKID